MLNNKGFDIWSNEYDKNVKSSDEENSYPFAGYKNIINIIFNKIIKKTNPTILDIGFGTAILTKNLYDKGCIIYGQDFSKKMIEIAYKKMPNANLYEGNLENGIVTPLKNQKYDYIISTYALHHLTNTQKTILLKDLLNYLKPNGEIFIGDIAFENYDELNLCKKNVGEEWDDEEIYFVIDELKNTFSNLKFIKVSYCSGIIILT